MKPSTLLSVLSTPGGSKKVYLKPTQYAGDQPFTGLLFDSNAHIVGVLESFQFKFRGYEDSFVDELLHQLSHSTNVPQARQQIRELIPVDSPRIKWPDGFISIKDYIRGFTGNVSDDQIVFKSQAYQIDILFHAHPWSGIANIFIGSHSIGQINLFNQECAVVRRFTVDNCDCKEISVIIEYAKNRDALAEGSQILIEGFIEYDQDRISVEYALRSSINRGGEFRHRFWELLESLDADAIVLDVGGGRRQVSDERYVNLEYTSLDEADIIADATELPFANNSIDMVYSAAVMEHVRDPLRFSSEIIRVLKPGGIALVNSACMQPLHSEGQHFFNATIWGIESAFAGLNNRKLWWEVGFADTIRWMIQVSGLPTVAPKEIIDRFISDSTQLEQYISYDRGKYIASGVWLEGTKPG